MPVSVDYFNKDIVAHIKALKPRAVLDIGAGKGKYGDICNSLGIPVDAIEPVASYVNEFNLKSKYRNVFEMDAKSFFALDREHKYDLIIAGDVMEHLYLYDAISVIDAMLYKARHVIIIWPTNAPQDSQFESHFEMHLNNMKLSDLSRFNIEVYKRTYGETWCDHPVFAHYALIAGHNTRFTESLRCIRIENNIAFEVINDV